MIGHSFVLGVDVEWSRELSPYLTNLSIILSAPGDSCLLCWWIARIVSSMVGGGCIYPLSSVDGTSNSPTFWLLSSSSICISISSAKDWRLSLMLVWMYNEKRIEICLTSRWDENRNRRARFRRDDRSYFSKMIHEPVGPAWYVGLICVKAWGAHNIRWIFSKSWERHKCNFKFTAFSVVS